MRGVFFGTSAFAVPALHAFARVVDCALVVTQPDRPSGRGHRMHPTPVKSAARALGISSIEPERLRAVASDLAALAPDVFAVASYGKIVPQALLDVPRLVALNVHPSLLPLYRGATPLQSQLRDGVTDGGVTIIAMDAGMDTGDIVLQERAAIGPRETYGDLHDRFAALGAELLARACADAAAGALARVPQAGLASDAEVAATATRPLAKADLRLDDIREARRFVDAVRAFAPQPLARLRLFDEDVKVAAAHVADAREAALVAAHASDDGWFVSPALPEAMCSVRDGVVVVERVVPPSRGPMSAGAYLRGAAGRTFA